MSNIRSNVDKMIKRRMVAAAVSFAVLHPFSTFNTKAARRKIRKQVMGKFGSSAWKPHQGKQECARRVRQGNAPMQYVKAVGKNLAMTDAQVQEFLERQNAKVQSTV